MVMGPGWLCLKRTFSKLASVRLPSILCIVLLLLLVNRATGRPGGRCKVDGCINSYKRADRHLKAAEERLDGDQNLSKRRCRVLKKLHRCLQKMHKACRGNLIFHSIKHMNDKNLLATNCSEKTRTISPNIMQTFPVKPDRKTLSVNTTLTPPSSEVTEGSTCTYAGTPNYRHCGLFGDPHLRTFFDKFYTCKIEKTWPLVENDYMVVMVTNVPVKEGASATVTTKITVLIRPAGECAGQRHYVATSEILPGGFTDGTSVSGSVVVVEKDPGRHIEIRARFIATTIIIRSVGGYLTFAIRMPQELIKGLNSKPQLCVDGCLPNQRITSAKQIESFNDVVHSDGNHQIVSPSQSKEAVPFPAKENSPFHDESTKSPETVHRKRSGQSLTKDDKSTPTYYSEKEARIKCQQIMLAPIEHQEQLHDDIRSERQTGEIPNRSEKSNQVSTSKAHSSRTGSARRKHRKRRKNNRMSATNGSHYEMSQSSFNQLFSTEEGETDAVSPRKSPNKRRRDRRKKNKSKRHATDRDNSANNEASTKPPACLSKTRSDDTSLNFYFESCIFDLITTGNVNFTLTARAALEDVLSTHVLKENAPGASMEVIKQWQPENFQSNIVCPGTVSTNDHGGADTLSGMTSLLALCLAFSCFYNNSISWLFFSSSNTVTNLRHQEFQYYLTIFCSKQVVSNLFLNKVAAR